jgi:hypothetical protein
VTLLDSMRPRDLQMSIQSRVSMPINENEEHKLRDLTRVMTEGLADKEPLIFMVISCLINMVYKSNIPQHLLSYSRKPGVLGQPLNTNFHMEWQ